MYLWLRVCVLISSGVPGPGCVGAVRSFWGLQCVSVCLRPNRIWKDIHHDGHTGEDMGWSGCRHNCMALHVIWGGVYKVQRSQRTYTKYKFKPCLTVNRKTLFKEKHSVVTQIYMSAVKLMLLYPHSVFCFCFVCCQDSIGLTPRICQVSKSIMIPASGNINKMNTLIIQLLVYLML